MDYIKIYNKWIENVKDESLLEELRSVKNDLSKIEEAFYKDLKFGTGGLRGIIGAGPNRLNIYTVGKITKGVSNYISLKGMKKCIAVSYDSRINSKLFAETVASVLAGNGIKTFIFKKLMPTPCLSFALRYLGCSMGIMITASHNPAEYNGYKIYDSDGGQITDKMAGDIAEQIEKVEVFDDFGGMEFEEGIEEGKVEYISDDVYKKYLDEIASLSLCKKDELDLNFKILYSPLNGTGLIPVADTLRRVGFKHVDIVEDQKLPDGSFPTCPKPNPEEKKTMEYGIKIAKEKGADIFIATDPDCDRIGVAVKNTQGEFVLMSGNEIGILLLEYILKTKREKNAIPEGAYVFKTIVTSDLAKRISDSYNVKMYEVLTGFKYIGEKISLMEKENSLEKFMFGLEESCGYLSGTHVRDKDGVNAALLVCEMASHYKKHGMTLTEAYEEIEKKYGKVKTQQLSFEFPGAEGEKRMKEIMSSFRTDFKGKNREDVLEVKDYIDGIDELPPSDVVKIFFKDESTLVVRPSGTEPKLKLYMGGEESKLKKLEKLSRDLIEGKGIQW